MRMSVLVRPKGSTSGADRIAKLLEKPIFAEVVEAAGGVEAVLAARVAVVEGDLADVPDAAERHRRGRALRRRRVVRPAGRRGVHHQRHRRPRPAGPDRRGAGRVRPGHPLRAHLDGVRRGPAPRQHPRGVGRARRRPRDRAGVGPRAAPGGRVPLPRRRRPDQGAQEGREGAQPRRAAHRRPRDRGRAQAVGQGRAGPDRHRAGPQPGLDRLLHVHQGDGRAGGRALGRPSRRPAPRLDRPAEHHRVRPRAPARRVDRGVQDGRAADPGLRPRRAAGVPGLGRHDRRHRPGRPRRLRDRRGAGPPAGARRRSATSTSPAATATR